jgi:hypothetical protein
MSLHDEDKRTRRREMGTISFGGLSNAPFEFLFLLFWLVLRALDHHYAVLLEYPPSFVIAGKEHSCYYSLEHSIYACKFI